MTKNLTPSDLPDFLMPEFKSIQAGEGNVFIIGSNNVVQNNLEAVKKLSAIKGVLELDVPQDTKFAAIADMVKDW